MEIEQEGNSTVVRSYSHLVDQDQKSPTTGEINCKTVYTFQPDKVILEFSAEKASSDPVRIILPIISNSSEKVEVIGKRQVQVQKEHAVVRIISDADLSILPTTGGRIFNFVLGLEAVPLAINQRRCRIEIEVV